MFFSKHRPMRNGVCYGVSEVPVYRRGDADEKREYGGQTEGEELPPSVSYREGDDYKKKICVERRAAEGRGEGEEKNFFLDLPQTPEDGVGGCVREYVAEADAGVVLHAGFAVSGA